MAPTRSARLVLAGNLPGGERFATGMWFTPEVTESNFPGDNPTALTVLQAMLAVSQWGTLFTQLKNALSTASSYQTATLYTYPTGGTAAAATAQVALSGGAGLGSGSSVNQVSRVVTLRTSQAGRSHRGRCYLPANGLACQNTTGLFTDNGQNLVNAMAAWAGALGLAEILPDPGGGVFLAVASSRLSSTTSVNLLTTDARPDIQRRRADKQAVGTISQAAVTYD